MPCRHRRSSTGRGPGDRRGHFGSSGSTTVHSASSTIHGLLLTPSRTAESSYRTRPPEPNHKIVLRALGEISHVKDSPDLTVTNAAENSNRTPQTSPTELWISVTEMILSRPRVPISSISSNTHDSTGQHQVGNTGHQPSETFRVQSVLQDNRTDGSDSSRSSIASTDAQLWVSSARYLTPNAASTRCPARRPTAFLCIISHTHTNRE